MAQIIPPITSLPLDSSAAPSAEDIQDRAPTICVDYLSHEWSEEDVWASWRSMTRHKHEIANGVRLENASWRTWQKQRNKLKTISPETLNWLKDSDVTWLYGPLHTAHVEPVRPLKIADATERLGIDVPESTRKQGPATAATKPILKHRTLSEMLTIPMPSSPVLESSNYHDDDIDSSEEGHDRPLLLQTKSDTNIIRNRSNPTRRKSPPRGPISTGKNTPHDGAVSPPVTSEPGTGKRHISFNTFVEQCVAIDDPSIPQPVEEEEESDDEMLEMKSSLSSSSRSSRPSLSRNSSSASADHLTIAKIAPTMLKTMNAPGGTSQMIYQPPPEYISPGLQSPNQQFDFPSPRNEQHAERWAEHDEDEDDYGSGSFDYFGGPDLTGEEGRRAQPIPSAGAYRAPTVNQPPPQPKWRQAPQSQPVEPSSTSSSSSSSSFNVTSPPQPSRSILKVRPPSNAVVPEPSSPTNAYFNYNPSAATGIGGMRGSTGSYENVGPTGSPVVSPVEERGRGRTASRERLNDRSTSRGTSSSSSPSVHSNTSRSPVDAPANPSRKVQTPPQLDKVQEGVTWSPNSQETSHNEYIPERSSTPTPHSSPQITFRPLKDTSPASLPHTSTSSPTTSELPKADPPTVLSPKTNTPTAKATTAHVGTNAQPTLSQPQQQQQSEVEKDDGEGEGGDGSSIIGRAANIANTAKDILGALWYGDGQGGQGASTQGGGGGRNHRRGASLG